MRNLKEIFDRLWVRYKDSPTNRSPFEFMSYMSFPILHQHQHIAYERHSMPHKHNDSLYEWIDSFVEEKLPLVKSSLPRKLEYNVIWSSEPTAFFSFIVLRRTFIRENRIKM